MWTGMVQRDGDNPWAKMAGSDRFVDNLRLGRVGGDKGTGQDRTRAFGTLPAKLPGSAHCYQTVVNASGPVEKASPVTLFERQCVRTTEDGETGLSHRENARQARPQIIWTSIKSQLCGPRAKEMEMDTTPMLRKEWKGTFFMQGTLHHYRHCQLHRRVSYTCRMSCRWTTFMAQTQTLRPTS
ncbi:hypothetical protein Bbelb_417430 [Branchiostoma belcheri]|nr:hypothetical protein Bbelb_417430 [Branchiostoma belcheri]